MSVGDSLRGAEIGGRSVDLLGYRDHLLTSLDRAALQRLATLSGRDYPPSAKQDEEIWDLMCRVAMSEMARSLSEGWAISMTEAKDRMVEALALHVFDDHWPHPEFVGDVLGMTESRAVTLISGTRARTRMSVKDKDTFVLRELRDQIDAFNDHDGLFRYLVRLSPDQARALNASIARLNPTLVPIRKSRAHAGLYEMDFRTFGWVVRDYGVSNLALPGDFVRRVSNLLAGRTGQVRLDQSLVGALDGELQSLGLANTGKRLVMIWGTVTKAEQAVMGSRPPLVKKQLLSTQLLQELVGVFGA